MGRMRTMWGAMAAVAVIGVGGIAARVGAAEPPGTLFLVPDRYEAKVGEKLPVHVAMKHGAVFGNCDWDAKSVSWFYIRVAGTQENRETVPGLGDAPPAPPSAPPPSPPPVPPAVPTPPAPAPVPSTPPDSTKPAQVAPPAPVVGPRAAMLPLVHAGLTMIGMDVRARVMNLPVEDVGTYLAAASDRDRILVLHSLPPGVAVECRLIESAAALVRVTGDEPSGPDAQTATSKAGQAAEIRFLSDPTATPVGGEVSLKTLVGGAARGEVKVTATFVPPVPDPAKPQVTEVVPPPPLEFLTDANGVGRFRLSLAGTWRLEMHAAKRLIGDADARVELHAATVTFNATGIGPAPDKTAPPAEPVKKDGGK